MCSSRPPVLYWTDLEFDRANPADAFVMDMAAHLLKQKLVQRRLEFRFYIQGVEIRDKNLFVDNTFDNERDFQLRNYEQLDQVASAFHCTSTTRL